MHQAGGQARGLHTTCSGSEAGSYLRLTDCVYHSTPSPGQVAAMALPLIRDVTRPKLDKPKPSGLRKKTKPSGLKTRKRVFE